MPQLTAFDAFLANSSQSKNGFSAVETVRLNLGVPTSDFGKVTGRVRQEEG